MQDLRNGICEALAEIPILLASTHRALGAFKKSKKLHQCSAALYSATISALRHIVDWYKEKAISKTCYAYRLDRDVTNSMLREVLQKYSQAELLRTAIERFD